VASVVGGRRIRRKLWVILALPLAVIAAMATLWGLVLAREYEASAAAADQVEPAMFADELVVALQRDRGLTFGLLRGEQAFGPLLTTERLRVDTARARYAQLVDQAAEADRPALRAAVDQLAQLDGLRADTDTQPTDRGAVIGAYTDLVRSVRAATASPFMGGVHDEQLGRGLDSLQALGAAEEATAAEAGQFVGIAVTGKFGPGEHAQFVELRAARLAALAHVERHAAAAQAARLEAALAGSAGETIADAEQAALTGSAAPALKISATAWWSATTSMTDELRGMQEDVGQAAQARSDVLQETALRRLAALGGFVLLAAIAGAGAVVAAARSLARPLARLADEADEVARVRLPEAAARLQKAVGDDADETPRLPSVADAVARGGTEVGRVANAIDNLQLTALSLATEQAVLRRRAAESLANLGRRNQNLVRRQLRLISDLERDESDPNVLANLFELDHLATRMRRNAESLLVLTDEESPRRWAAPMPVADVIRSAIAEVEDYRRVMLRRTDEVRIVGTVVAGLAHLLAELIENALSFSPPDQDVEIYARSDGGGCLIAVVDHGMGMSADGLATANDRLAGAERPAVAPTRFLGHHVVGRLAERLGVRVHLHESPLTGTTAKVTLPAELVVPPKAVEEGEPPAPRGGDGDDQPRPPRSRDVREAVVGGPEPVRVPALVPPSPGELSARAQRLLRRPRRPEPEPGTSPPAATPVEPAPAAQPAAPALSAPRTATTRNGLIKRVPRRQRSDDARRPEPAPAEPAPRAPAERPPAATPEEVGGRLSTLRAAVRRAEAADEQPPPGPGPELAAVTDDPAPEGGNRSSADEGVT
jgi:signal transduction histidine kinase